MSHAAPHVGRLSCKPDPGYLRAVQRAQTRKADHPSASIPPAMYVNDPRRIRLHYKTAAANKTNLNPPASLRRCPWMMRLLLRRHLHFDELSLFRLSQPLLPCEQLRRCHTPGMAKCRYALSARQLLGHQTSPSRPQLRTAFSHAYKVTHTHAAFKMGFRYRSR
jgi:hypothetical protein